MFGRKKDGEYGQNGDTRRQFEKVQERLTRQDGRIDRIAARVTYLQRIVEVQKRASGTC